MLQPIFHHFLASYTHLKWNKSDQNPGEENENTQVDVSFHHFLCVSVRFGHIPPWSLKVEVNAANASRLRKSLEILFKPGLVSDVPGGRNRPGYAQIHLDTPGTAR